MKLIKLKIKNFRAYEGDYSIHFDSQFTSFIGKNDIGKSTVFDALDIFFGNKKLDLGDICVSSSEKIVEIGCTFSDLPKTLEIDTSAETNLADEYLLNNDGNLEIKKIYHCTEKTVPSIPEINIVANYPSASKVPFLHSLNQNQLKELGQSKNLAVSDERMNHLWRKAIWNSIGNLELTITELKIDQFEVKAKKIYSKIEDFMPFFFAFRADREMTDTDAEAKDPMQLAVAEAQDELNSDIEVIKEKIQKRVEEVAESALSKLHDIDPRLAKQLNPVLKAKPSWKFEYRIEDDRGVPLNKRGSGTRRLVLLNFFRAQAEKKSGETSRGIVYAIEEPETSQHPDNQKLVVNTLLDLAKDANRQVIITTHSPELLREIEEKHRDGIQFIQTDSSNTREVITGDDALILAANALGILGKQQFGSAERVVLVEGKSDCLFLEHAARVMKESGEISKDLVAAKVEVLPLGGLPGIKDWIEMDKHTELGLKTYIFLDSDRLDNSKSQTENEKYADSLSADSAIKKSFCTKKREIENYIKKELTGCEFGDYDDVKEIVSAAKSIPKNKIVEKYWTMMTAIDIDAEIKGIIKDVVS